MDQIIGEQLSAYKQQSQNNDCEKQCVFVADEFSAREKFGNAVNKRFKRIIKLRPERTVVILPFLRKYRYEPIISRMSRKPMSDAKIDQNILMMIAIIPPKYIRPVIAILLRIVESAYSRPIETAGEKSRLPICIHLTPRNILRNGSHKPERKTTES
jgi:hypothetical protein